MDWNSDGRRDILIGDSVGNVYIYFNREDQGNSYLEKRQLTYRGGKKLNAGSRASPVAYDWNGDGLLDIISGSMDGLLRVYINSGSADNPAFDKPFNIKAGSTDMDVGTRSAPRIYDWNKDGLDDILIGEMKGFVYWARNEGSADNPVFRRVDKLFMNNGKPLRYPSPSGAPRSRLYVTDWNNDGLDDILVGGADGRIMVFMARHERQDTLTVLINRILATAHETAVKIMNTVRQFARDIKHAVM